MLEAPTAELKQQGDATRTTALPERQRTLHPLQPDVRSLGRTPPFSPGPSQGHLRHHFAGLQHAFASQTALRMLDRYRNVQWPRLHASAAKVYKRNLPSTNLAMNTSRRRAASREPLCACVIRSKRRNLSVRLLWHHRFRENALVAARRGNAPNAK